MPTSFNALRRLLMVWRAEHIRVVDAGAAVNLNRTRWVTPVVAALDLLGALVFLAKVLTNPDSHSVTYRWEVAQALTYTAMGLLMVGFSVAAHRFRHASRLRHGQLLPVVLVCTGMLFAVAKVAFDQWITPNITPFLIACMAASLLLYLRPLPAAVMYLMYFLAFYIAMGITQQNAAILLSNRFNGFVACVLGWSLSVLLWRQFTLLTLQQNQLETANAELQEKQRDLERLTRNDGLTGLFNRNTFAELARQELLRAQRQGTPTTILLMDLDFFKKVNDTWGHPAGDAVLKNVAFIANQTVRSTDLVGRLGGEEFTVLLPATSVDAARRLAEKLRNQLQNNPTPWENTVIPCTVSIGVAGTTARENRDFDTLYREADKALYVAKTQGRNRVI